MLTPAEVAHTLSKISREIDDTTKELAKLDFDSVLARKEYVKARARVFLDTEGPMDVKRATAELECSEIYFAAEVSDQELRACNARLKALRDRLEVGRSIGALVRLEWTAG